MSVHVLVDRARAAKRHWRATRRKVQRGDTPPVAEQNAWTAYTMARARLEELERSGKASESDRRTARIELAVLNRGNQ